MMRNDHPAEKNSAPDVRPAATIATWANRLPAIVFVATLAIGLVLVLVLSLPSRAAPLRVGDVAKQNVRSPQRVTYVSQIKTRQAKEAAAAAVADVYEYDPGVAQQLRSQAQMLFNGIANIRADVNTTPEQKQDRVQRLAEGIASPTTTKLILATSDLAWPRVVTETARVLDEVMRDRVRPSDLPTIRAKLASRFSQDLTSEQLAVAVAIVSDLIKPNETFNAAETQRQKREAQDKVEPIRETVEKGEIVVREGNVVTALDLEKLEAVGLQQASVSWADIASAVLLVILVVGTLYGYLVHFQPRLLAQDYHSLLLAVGFLVMALAARLAAGTRLLESVTWVYLVPFAVLPLLVGMLLDQQLGVVVAVLLGIVAGYTSGRQLDVATMVALGGALGALRSRPIERLGTFFWLGIIIGLANLAVILAFSLTAPDRDSTALLAASLMVLVNGALAAAITGITFAPLGNLLGVTTVLHLLELAHPSQPLFRRLLLEAPGTYHHSVIISTLAERAAAAIGADSLLARVGAYYHDIGKIVRPYLYIENQINSVNVHDTFDAKTSAKAVMAHVTEGIALARKHRLPPRIVDMIPQHHGTKLVGYFYARARAEDPNVDEADFRYPGPKPQSKEAAILMLADGVEAAVRASRDHSPETITQIVSDIISAHVADGQLSECDLTLKDLETIRQSFTGVLQGVYHPRIAYPPSIPEAGTAELPIPLPATSSQSALVQSSPPKRRGRAKSR